jgi:ribosomal protein S14
MFLKQLDKDKVRRILSNNLELKLIALNNLRQPLNDDRLPFKVMLSILFMFYKLSRDCFSNRSNNICIMTGRQSGVYKVLKISRIEIRDSKYNLYGLRKSSW